MKGIYIFLADGFEDVEALGTNDVLRRAGLRSELVCIKEEPFVQSSHGITIGVDDCLPFLDTDHAGTTEKDVLIFPGGMPGSKSLAACKPLIKLMQDFQRAAQRLKERLEGNPAPQVVTPTPQDDTLFLKTDYRIVKVSIADIRYVEAMSEYLKVYLRHEDKPIITLLSMKKMEERLPSNFMRIHRSYIINLNDIQEVNKNRVIMDADTYLPIGDMYREAFQNYLNTNFLGK